MFSEIFPVVLFCHMIFLTMFNLLDLEILHFDLVPNPMGEKNVRVKLLHLVMEPCDHFQLSYRSKMHSMIISWGRSRSD